jgi:hypothetical protein
MAREAGTMALLPSSSASWVGLLRPSGGGCDRGLRRVTTLVAYSRTSRWDRRSISRFSVAAGLVMLAGSFVIPVVVLLCTGRFRAWGVARALAVALPGVLAALQCVYMVAHFMHVAPFPAVSRKRAGPTERSRT